jgi:raffinose/stachyose/melibiose transport system permease protein
MTVAPEFDRVPQTLNHKAPMHWSQPIVYLVAVIAAAVSIIPVSFVVLGGFRTNIQLLESPAGFPNPWIFSNYAQILVGRNASVFWGSVAASVFVALMTVLLVVVLGTSVAYAIARMNLRGAGALFAVFAAGLMFPATIAILPTWVILREIGLLGNHMGVVIPQVAFALPTTVVILTPFLKAIPKEMEEAAYLDGCTRTGFFFRILLPLSKPGMVTVGVLAFVGSWNAYMLPLFVLQVGGANVQIAGLDLSRTLPLGVQQFQSQWSTNVTLVMAFTSLAVIPALVFFLTMEKHIVNGLAGAVKG